MKQLVLPFIEEKEKEMNLKNTIDSLVITGIIGGFYGGFTMGFLDINTSGLPYYSGSILALKSLTDFMMYPKIIKKMKLYKKLFYLGFYPLSVAIPFNAKYDPELYKNCLDLIDKLI